VSNSLVIANSVELLGGGVPSTIPLGAGATYYLTPGWSLGSPQPTVDIAGTLMVDGERPFGRRASNRQPTLPVTIVAPDETTLAAAREALLMLVDQDTWLLRWVRDGGQLPILFDCFRALPSVVTYSIPYQNALVSQVAITFQSLPYGRSDTQQQVAFPAPLPGSPPAPPPPLVLDNFATISSGPLWVQSQTCIVGPNTGFWDPSPGGFPNGANTPMVYSNTFSPPVSISGLTGLSFWLGLGSRFWWNLEHQGRSKLSMAFTFTDSDGTVLRFWLNKKLHAANSTSSPAWSFISIAIPQGNADFNYGSVSAMSVTITNRVKPSECRHVLFWLDNIVANPPARVGSAPSTRGKAYIISGVQGTSHAPISIQAQGAAAPGTPTTFSTAGVNNYTVPGGTVYLQVEAIGGGGAGAGETGAGFGGGGGGGGYSQEPVFPAAAAQVINFNVGAGGSQGASPIDGQDTTFGPGPSSTLVVTARGGKSALQNSIVGGLGGLVSTNTISFPGGTGRTASGSVGGGGGSSASAAGPGNTPTGTANVVLTGSGNFTVPAGVTQITVTAIGAGGGAGSGGVGNGAGAGGGESATQTFTVTPGAVIAYACGSGGTPGASTGDLPGHDGGDTTFGPVSGAGTLTAHGGKLGTSSTHTVNGGLGGSGSTAPIHFNGGQGGATGPYPGSGGSSAGTSAPGNAGSPYTSGAVAAPVGGGAGGFSSGPHSANAGSGTLPGGGGGATWSSGFTAGTGGNGQITVSYPGGAPTNNGATPPTGGGGGGAGGPSSNTVGTAGSAPGGAGGGADSAGTAEAGGAGAAGKIVITPFSLAAFKTLILHRPRADAPPSLMPFVSVGNGANAPSGSTEYSVASLVTGVNAKFSGTYSVVLIASSFNTPANPRTITVTVKQYEFASGPAYTQSVAVTVTPTGGVVNNILVVGEITLPVKDIASDNSAGLFTVIVNDTNTSDRFNDCLFLDTAGQTVIINEPTSGYLNYFIDEPDPNALLGRHLGSSADRSSAISVLDACMALSGGALTVEPGDNLLLAYSADGGAPAIGVSYFPRWFIDRAY
jgi:hypothetical protein